MRPHVLTQWLRLAHLYLGLFTAPAILFFAFTGAMQTLSLNDRSPDGSYTPPHWISVLAQIHKKQSAQLPQRKPENGAAPRPQKTPSIPATQEKTAPQQSAQATPNPASPNPATLKPLPPGKPLGMQIFFLMVCVSLFASTFSGAWMAWRYRRSRIAICAVFVAGIVIPLLLMKW